MERNGWRLIRDVPSDGRTNMDKDKTLFEQFDPRYSKPVFRVYGWNPPAVSVGRFQDPGDFLDLETCRRKGIDVVRRITGGGAIFHANEVTYSLVCPASMLPADLSVAESFKLLTDFLLRFYADLGLDARYAAEVSSLPAAELGKPSNMCYAGQERYDILADGKKLGGNAQRRTRETIFQHGSIPLAPLSTGSGTGNSDPFEGCLLRAIDTPAGATNLAELGVKLSFEEAAGLLIKSFDPFR